MIETQQQPSVTPIAAKYGFLGALVSIVFSAVLLVAGVDVSSWIGSLGYIILIAAIVIAIKEYKKLNYGYMSYGQGLGIGTLVSAIFGLLGGIFMFVYSSFIDPSYQESIVEKQRIELENKGFSDEQIDQSMAMTESFTSPAMMVVWSLVGYILIGFILSLIISAIMKNSRPEFE